MIYCLDDDDDYYCYYCYYCYYYYCCYYYLLSLLLIFLLSFISFWFLNKNSLLFLWVSWLFAFVSCNFMSFNLIHATTIWCWHTTVILSLASCWNEGKRHGQIVDVIWAISYLVVSPHSAHWGIKLPQKHHCSVSCQAPSLKIAPPCKTSPPSFPATPSKNWGPVKHPFLKIV